MNQRHRPLRRWNWHPVGALLAAWLLAAPVGAGAAEAPLPAGPHSEVEAQLGIRIIGLRRSSAGYMLDFRYVVMDPAKAATLLDRKITPYLLDEASGARLGVPSAPKVGQLRPTARHGATPGRNYYILFANPGRYLGAGSKVSLVAGETRIDHLTVE